MNFRHRRLEEPEINLIPFIDVLLVILIFLMLSTTYSKYSELQITLPSADAEQLKDRPKEVIVGIAADGRFVVNRQPVEGRSVDILVTALRERFDLGFLPAAAPDVDVRGHVDHVAKRRHQRPQAVRRGIRPLGMR